MARRHISREAKAAAQEDFIAGLSLTQVEAKHKISHSTAYQWRGEVAGQVLEAIERRNAEAQAGFKITAERVLEEYARIAFYNPGRVFKKDENGLPKIDYSDADDSDFAVIQEVSNEQVAQYSLDLDGDGKTRTTKAKVKLYSKLDALNQIGKHLGMFTDKVDVTSNGKELTTIRVVYADVDPNTQDPAPSPETDS